MAEPTATEMVAQPSEGVSTPSPSVPAAIAEEKDRALSNAPFSGPLAQRLLEAAESKWATGIMLVATVYALWGTDLYAVTDAPISSDAGILSIVLACFILFTGELIIFTLCKSDYLLSFFFYLDILAALSLLPDVLLLFGINITSGDSLTVARAGRAARAGTRAARIVRVIKLITLVKSAREKPEEHEFKESKIGGQLADLITQKVIVIVGAMLISTSLLELLTTAADYSFAAELDNLSLMTARFNATATYGSYVAKFIVDHDTKRFDKDTLAANLVDLQAMVGGSSWPTWPNPWLPASHDACGSSTMRYLEIRGQPIWCADTDGDDLRTTEKETVGVGASGMQTKIIFDQRQFNKGQSVVNIVQIMFIVILLGVSSALFNKDAETLVIQPLASMAALVQRMSANPLAEIHDSGERGDYETDFVESALKKFGKLLQVAFGEAGAEIIGANMSSGGELNLMMAGNKVQGIFGFVVIFHFAECTECLQEDIMTFVNQVASYIHIAVKQNEGFTNKNIGEAWLLAWRMPEAMPDDMSSFTKANSALKAFVRVCLQTSVCPKLASLTTHPKIQERVPGFQLRGNMGFGLHVGWAIQGAIGSDLKIDASFLSPNVNLSARLESANHIFGTSILMSGQFHHLLSSEVQQLCRKIDVVTVKGSAHPMELWTYDVPYDNFTELKQLEYEEGVPYFEQFKPQTSSEYRAQFHLAVEAYIAGRWDQAKEVLGDCLSKYPNDGPGETLMRILSSHKFVAPEGWKGYRELTEK